MSCPFLREQPVAEGARIIRRAFRINRVLRQRQDPLAQRDSVLLERYRFSREGVIYIMNLLEPHIKRSTRRSRALTTARTVCIALRFFASGTFLYTIGDAENLAKSAVCRAIRKFTWRSSTFRCYCSLSKPLKTPSCKTIHCCYDICAQPYLKPCFMCPFYILSTCPSKGLCMEANKCHNSARPC